MTGALIVVDMQNGFLREGALASERCLAVLPAVTREVDAALARGDLVVFTADTHEVQDAEFEMFPEHCVRGTHEAELVDELLGYLDQPPRRDLDGGPGGAVKVAKRRYSALFESELEGHLHRYGIDDVRICGVCTDICVLHTTADLRNRDLPVTVVADATATFDAPGHDAEQVEAAMLTHMEAILGATIERGGTER